MNRRLYFITLNWNTTLLKRMVASVEATVTLPHQWIIIDNGSDRENWGELKRWAQERNLDNGARGYLHRYEANQGLIVGHNRAFDLAALCKQPHEIVMVDTDVLIWQENWLGETLAWADEHPQVGIVGLEHSRREEGAPPVFLDPSGYWYIHEEQPGEPTEGESVGLGVALLRWPVLEAGLRFDPGFRIYYKQDDDLCFQVRAALGLEVWVYPIPGLDHWGSGSLKQSDYQCAGCDGKSEWDRMKSRNQEYFARKWAWALRPRRPALAAEAEHLREMKEIMARERGG